MACKPTWDSILSPQSERGEGEESLCVSQHETPQKQAQENQVRRNLEDGNAIKDVLSLAWGKERRKMGGRDGRLLPISTEVASVSAAEFHTTARVLG
jgi:hypothetical protein